jgi:two-component system sensor histidine kinase UhpB
MQYCDSHEWIAALESATQMSAYRLLHVEDSPDDAELVHFALRTAPFEAAITRVDTEPGFVGRLDGEPPDVVICDYNMPQFSAERALEILRERGLDIPFIIVSHHIDEGAAVIAMQQGASDYLPKRHLERLAKAIESAVDRTRARAEKERAVEALKQSEAMKRGILDSLRSRIALVDGDGIIVAVNKDWEGHEERKAMNVRRAAPGEDYVRMLKESESEGNTFAEALAEGIEAVIARKRTVFSLEYELQVGSAPRWFMARAMPLEGGARGAVVSHTDITDRMMSHVALLDANKRLQVLSKRMLAIQEDERRAISRELHDDIGQTLGALTIGLHRLTQNATGEQSSLVGGCLSAAQDALDKLRSLAMDLRPPQLDQLGLGDALEWLVERQRAATGLDIACRFAGLENRLPPSLESACYRITQEALNNATRHSKAKAVQIGVESDGRLLKLTIHDDGIGFDEEAARQRVLKAGSMGLIGMDERAQLAGGRLKLRSVPGGGTTVSAIFPLGAVASDRAGMAVEVPAP